MVEQGSGPQAIQTDVDFCVETGEKVTLPASALGPAPTAEQPALPQAPPFQAERGPDARRFGRPPRLGEIERELICGLLEKGWTRTAAARCVRCAPNTLRNTARRDPAFHAALAAAERAHAVACMEHFMLREMVRRSLPRRS